MTVESEEDCLFMNGLRFGLYLFCNYFVGFDILKVGACSGEVEWNGVKWYYIL